MNDALIILFIIFDIVLVIIFGMFSYSAIDNLGESFCNNSYTNKYRSKAIGYFIYSIIFGYIAISIYNLLILKLQL